MIIPTTRRFVLIAVALVGLFFATPALAQEGGERVDSATPPQGVTVLILMLGLAAIAAVGVYYLAQNNANRATDGDDDE
ncbi:MAG TPA: hypothetical protein PLD47_10100 [Aggregatilineales bacterium]|nr:hypothetical protein [Anaerolineales bacterium]HRE48065.1 hypothetical protein [Aggregatilineales bacterium]